MHNTLSNFSLGSVSVSSSLEIRSARFVIIADFAGLFSCIANLTVAAQDYFNISLWSK